MREIDIKFSGISQQVETIVVRITGGEFLTGGKVDFTLSGTTRGVSVTGDTIRFTPVFPGLGVPNFDLSVGVAAGAGGDPVIEIDTELSMFALGATPSQPLIPGQSPNMPSPFGMPLGSALGGVVGSTLGHLLPFAQSPMGLGVPAPQPPAPSVEQEITVRWQTATEMRSERATLRVPLTLAGYAE